MAKGTVKAQEIRLWTAPGTSTETAPKEEEREDWWNGPSDPEEADDGDPEDAEDEDGDEGDDGDESTVLWVRAIQMTNGVRLVAVDPKDGRIQLCGNLLELRPEHVVRFSSVVTNPSLPRDGDGRVKIKGVDE